MRIAVHDYGGYPFTAQLARALAERGHDVVYLFAEGIKTPRARVVARDRDPITVTYRGVRLDEEYRRAAGVGRMRQERRYGAVLAREIANARPDVVLSGNTPLTAQRACQLAAAEAGAGFVHWLQDVYSEAVARLLRRRLSILGSVVAAPYALLERRIVRAADAIVLIADDFSAVMVRWGVPAERTTVIENWAPLDEVEPRDRVNPWSDEHGLNDEVAFLYAGTLGRKHDPDLLRRLAEALPDARVVVVAEGSGMDRLRSTKRLPANLSLLPVEPSESVPDMLATADVLVALLSDDAGTFSVPSKVLTYLAAGRPVIGVIPSANLAARVIADSGGGTVVQPDDKEAFLSAARHYFADADARATAGSASRAWATANFDIGAKAAAFEAVLSAAHQRAHSRLGHGTDTSQVMQRNPDR